MDSKSKISAVLVEDVTGVEESKELARITLVETYKYDWVYTLEAQNRLELASVYTEILCEGQERGEIQKDLDCKHIARLIVAIYFNALYTGIELDADINLKDYLIKSIDVLWNGISA